MATRPPWWRTRPEDGPERRVREDAFRDHTLRAYRGDTGPLRDYLHSDLKLRPDHRDLLAELIYWRIQIKPRHKRGPGAPTVNRGRESERHIVYLTRRLKQQRYGDAKLPKGGWRKLLNEVIQHLDAMTWFDDARGTISEQRILADLNRGKRRASTAQRPDQLRG